MSVSLDFRTPEHIERQREHLERAALEAEAEYDRTYQEFVSAAIADAVRPAMWAAESQTALEFARAANATATEAWRKIRSRLAQLPPRGE